MSNSVIYDETERGPLNRGFLSVFYCGYGMFLSFFILPSYFLKTFQAFPVIIYSAKRYFLI